MPSEWPLAGRSYWNYLSKGNKAISPGTVSLMWKQKFSRAAALRCLLLGERERKEEKLLLYNSIKVVCKNVLPIETGGVA